MHRSVIALVVFLTLAALACNLAPAATPTAPPPTPTATPLPPTPSPAPAGGTVCVLAYHDSNHNAMRDGGEEPMAGVIFVLEQERIALEQVESTIASEPLCFSEHAPGQYMLHASWPETIQPTNPATLSITLTSNSRIPVVLGFVPVAQTEMKRFELDLAASGLIAPQTGDQLIRILTPASIWQTDDGGINWSQAGNTPPVETIVASPADPKLLFAGDPPPCFRDTPATALLISHDGGASWQENAAGAVLQPLAAHPDDPTIAWAAGCDGAYLSTDQGQSWQHQPADAWNLYQLVAIQPAASDPTIVWAAGNSEGGSGAVFRSDDGGRSWQTVKDQLGLWVTALLTDPHNPSWVWVATPNGIWRSSDNGRDWSFSADGLESVAVGSALDFQDRGLLALALLDDALYLGTANGLYVSRDAGRRWQPVTDTLWQGERIDQLAVSRGDSVTILWLATESGVFRFSNPAP